MMRRQGLQGGVCVIGGERKKQAENGAKERLTELQILVQQAAFAKFICKIQLQNSPVTPRDCRLTFGKGALCFLYPNSSAHSDRPAATTRSAAAAGLK
jgi:hypothetical protein